MILAPTLTLSAGSGAAIARPTFSRDFAGEKTLNNGTGPAITFTRGTNATFFDASGTLRFAPHNAIRNSQAGGATVGVIGSGGATPTHWNAIVNNGTGISSEILGTGTSGGFSYVDVKFNGISTSGVSGQIAVNFETSTQIVASLGQTWTGSVYVALVGGSLSGMTNLQVDVVERSVAGAYLLGQQVSIESAITSELKRFSVTRPFNQATVERTSHRIVGNFPIAATINFTLRIAAPQLEQNATASTYIPTTGTANFDQPRFDHDPATGASRGLLIEEARTNSIRNSQAGGSTNGVIGSGGVLSTNWFTSSPAGNTYEILGAGKQNGLAYIDIKFSGTNSSGGNIFPAVNFEATTQIVAAQNQVWTGSFYVTLTAGTTSGVSSFNCGVSERDASGTQLANSQTAFTPSATRQRIDHTRTMASASTGRVMSFFSCTVANGNSYDFTLRIAAPQLEQGAFPTSYIPTTSAAATRSADSAVVTPISGFYNQSEGTLFAELQRDTLNTNLITIASLDDNTLNNRVAMGLQGGSGRRMRVTIVTATASQWDEFNAGNSSVWPTRVIVAYKASDFAATVQGGAVVSQASGTVPTATHLYIGNRGGSALLANGHIRKIAYYPRRLSNALLQQLTT